MTKDEKAILTEVPSQAEGTSTDVALLDRKDMNTANDVFDAVSKLNLSKKYMDFTSSAETTMNFADAVASLSEMGDQVAL